MVSQLELRRHARELKTERASRKERSVELGRARAEIERLRSRLARFEKRKAPLTASRSRR